MNQLRKLTPTHMILCVVLLVALVLVFGVGTGGVGIFLIACLAMLGAMMWMMMGGSGTNRS